METIETSANEPDNAEAWGEVFRFNGLCRFEDFWEMDERWFEPPNRRRGGWSGVTRLDLALPRGGSVAVFVKRQENHFTRVWNHPLRGIPTLLREYRNLLQSKARGISAPEPLFFETRNVRGNARAVLVTRELTGYRALDAWSKTWMEQGWPALPERRIIIETLAEAIRRLHGHRVVHGALYGKHVLLRWTAAAGPDRSERVAACVIDFEKARLAWSGRRLVARDLDTLNRHTPGWRLVDRLRFLKAYGRGRSGATIRRWWRLLAKQAARAKPHRRAGGGRVEGAKN